MKINVNKECRDTEGFKLIVRRVTENRTEQGSCANYKEFWEKILFQFY